MICYLFPLLSGLLTIIIIGAMALDSVLQRSDDAANPFRDATRNGRKRP